MRRGAEIIIGTPGRLIDLMERKALLLENIQIFVLDETDQMLNQGFQEDIEKILNFVKLDCEKDGKNYDKI